MKKTGLVLLQVFLFSLVFGQNDNYPKAFVDFDAFLELAQEVKPYREKRLISVNQFLEFAQDSNTIILDTRSDSMYKAKHIAGAIHINFSDFTQEYLKEIIPNPDVRILIYCNNNFESMDDYFPTKSAEPAIIDKDIKPITLALNIPTFINLYCYGYQNVYELNELIGPFQNRIKFEGTAVK